MAVPVIHPVEQRDRSLQRLHDLTFAFAAGGAALLGLFAIVAAATVPGQSDGSATASSASSGTTATSDDNSSSNGPSQVQAPNQGSFGPGSGRPIAVSGGSR
jgi:hypothetical protein